MTDTYLSNHGMAVQLIARQEGLIERLRGELREAADAIERLRAQVSELILLERPFRIPVRSGEDITAVLERHIRKAMREPDPEQKP